MLFIELEPISDYPSHLTTVYTHRLILIYRK